MLNIIGIGLNDFSDITLKGKELIEKSDEIHLEVYTSKLSYSSYDEIKKEFKRIFKKDLMLAFRQDIENNEAKLLASAKTKNVSILVIGDALSATTHAGLMLEAKKQDITTNIVHNASVFNAVAITGLQLYKFGKTPSLVLEDTVKDKDGKPCLPESPYRTIRENRSIKAHTLVLLDIKIDEQSSRFMTIKDAITILKKMDDEYKKNYDNKAILDDKSKAIGIARLGAKDQTIAYGTLRELIKFDFGKPVHCLIIPGELHFVEEELLEQYSIDKKKSANIKK